MPGTRNVLCNTSSCGRVGTVKFICAFATRPSRYLDILALVMPGGGIKAVLWPPINVVCSGPLTLSLKSLTRPSGVFMASVYTSVVPLGVYVYPIKYSPDLLEYISLYTISLGVPWMPKANPVQSL